MIQTLLPKTFIICIPPIFLIWDWRITVSLGDDVRGNITRLDNAIDNFADRIADAENALQNLEQQKQAAEVEVAKPFAQEEELAEKSARLAELNALLNIDRSSAQNSPEKT